MPISKAHWRQQGFAKVVIPCLSLFLQRGWLNEGLVREAHYALLQR